MNEQHAPPNHHANYPGFKGVAGIVAALSMVFGRNGDAQLAVRLSGMGPGDRVVDVGCGPGVAVRYSARQGATVTGVDPAPVMLRVARLLTRSSAKVRYAKGAAEEIPLPEGSVSVVWSIATVHHWSDIDAGLREVRRVLLPGGRLVAMERRARTRCPRAREPWLDRRTSRRLCGSMPRTRLHRRSSGTGNNRAPIDSQRGSQRVLMLWS